MKMPKKKKAKTNWDRRLRQAHSDRHTLTNYSYTACEAISPSWYQKLDDNNLYATISQGPHPVHHHHQQNSVSYTSMAFQCQKMVLHALKALHLPSNAGNAEAKKEPPKKIDWTGPEQLRLGQYYSNTSHIRDTAQPIEGKFGHCSLYTTIFPESPQCTTTAINKTRVCAAEALQ
ncbi:hypothetical protein HRR90_003673 [Exophiala dermatitidis]|uniref:Uncharacterized protein n=1 Tax=Exophiala dermatitidis TaxID=5970 RepID=A0AAN6ERA2_EXODE|nr:hypothetical protein HRR86_004634 [Exophiala dermatitidis]KAJ4626507.1 hypothetical protein HRR88_004112 [Exophiala dermatitidis]KAJ4642946.1 hypothetical protein HRR89_003437 [Exophiala dermatitidis]KAJ4652488.1 hypothetical protein HRR91_004837 [Exophiala dermatitidis]KAJ4654875.1 hypothetical protein HRR90_003673 [Exophiala dermatitidis]